MKKTNHVLKSKLTILLPGTLLIFVILYLVHVNSFQSKTGADLIKEFEGAYVMTLCSVHIYSDATFKFTYASDLDPGNPPRTWGIISVENTEFILTPNQAENGFNPCILSTLTPVYWGNRKYLIPTEMYENFCQAIKKGEEPRERLSKGSAYLRIHDENIWVIGSPKKANGQLYCQFR